MLTAPRLCPQLSIVALPIGNFQDLSPRARSNLEQAEGILCEDTRRFRDLAKRSGLDLARLKLCDAMPADQEHSRDWQKFFAAHSDIKHWALVSDAGTPVVNDPGRGLLTYCRNQAWMIQAIPGPSAPIAAWQWSGGFGLPFIFAGFVPKAKGPGTKALVDFFSPMQIAKTFCFFDTRHQFSVTLEHLLKQGLGSRQAFAAREMSKEHEQLHVGSVEQVGRELLELLNTEDRLGELTLLIEGDSQTSFSQDKVSVETLRKIRNSAPKEAAKLAATLTGVATSEIYDLFTSKDKS